MKKKDWIAIMSILLAFANTYYINDFLHMCVFLIFYWMVVLYYNLDYKEKLKKMRADNNE